MRVIALVVAASIAGGASLGNDRTRPATIFVDSQARPGGDGSSEAPYRSIAEALEHARGIRNESQGRIMIWVAPGEYREESPLYLDISRIDLSGSTRLIAGADGLPQNCGPVAAPAPCVERGTETILTPTRPLTTGQVILFIAPTRNGAGDRVSNVSVHGFVFDGLAAAVSSSGAAIFVDRAVNFAVHGNVTRRVMVGIVTRMASGKIEGNFAYNNNDGVGITGGSVVYPAKVDLRANRLTSNLAQGGVAVGTAGVNFQIIGPDLSPIQTLFDPAQHPEQVPDKLELVVTANDLSRNGAFGLRFEHYLSNNSFYDTTANQPMTSKISATMRDNTCRDNGEYGVTVEGAFATRTNPRRFVAEFTGAFADNDLSGNGRSGMFFGFMLNGAVTRNPGLISTNKYMQNSSLLVTVDSRTESFGVDYDNPVLDPFVKATPLENTLIVNGVAQPGRRVTCPPGFPCSP